MVKYRENDKGKNKKTSLQNTLIWYSPAKSPFKVSGFAWFDEERIYRRLPSWASTYIPKEVNRLANHTSGGQIRFQTNSSKLSIYVELTGPANMPHMPATGQCGVDCYVSEEDTLTNFKYVDTTKFNITETTYKFTFFDDWNPSFRNIVLNLPLYQGVKKILIGLNADANIKKPPHYLTDQKVIIYGTSVTQGGCAARPGMSYTNILSRRIPLEFINLGFSGNGRGEPELAKIISTIPNPACLILDYEGNCVSTEIFRKTLPIFIQIYREKHPKTPIIIPSRIKYARENLINSLYETRMERREFEQSLVRQLRNRGDRHVYFFDHSKTLGYSDTFFECTVDGAHPTDLGFLRMAEALEPSLKTLLL